MKYKYSKEKAKKILEKYNKGGGVSLPVDKTISKQEIDSFIDYVNEYYGKKGIYADQLDGGFTKAELKKAVNKYISNLDKNSTWGYGDSLDRERVRQILQPSYKLYSEGGYAEKGIKVETLDEKIDLTEDGKVRARKTQEGKNLSYGELRERHGASPEALAFAKGGGVRKVGNREYSTGRNWTNDHNHVNKSEKHEVNYNRKSSFFFAEGGSIGQMVNFEDWQLYDRDTDLERMKKSCNAIRKNGFKAIVVEDKGMYYVLYKSMSDSEGKRVYAEGGSLGNHGLKQGDEIIKTMSGGVQKVKTKSGDIVYVNLANGYRGDTPPLPFAKGGYTNERRHVNKAQDYEVRYAKNKPNRTGYLGKRSFDDGGEISSKQLDLGYQYSFEKDEDNVGSLYKEAGVYSVIGFENGKHFSESFEKFTDAKKFYLDKKGKVKFDDGGFIDGFNPKSFSLAEIDEKLRDNDIYIQWLQMGDLNTSADKRDFLWTNTSSSTKWNKVKDLRLTISDYGLLELSKGSENLYLNFVVYEKDGYDPMNIQIYTKDNHAGLKQFARQIVDKFEEGGFMTDPNFGDFQNQVYSKGGGVGEKYLVDGDRVLNTETNMYVDYDFETKERAEDFAKTKNDRIKKHGVDYATGGVTKNYINRNQLNTITIKKGDKKLTYKVSDVYNGAYKLEDGGNLERTAFYVSKRNVVKVQLKDGKDVKVANGYWIKKGAKPIHTSKYDDGGQLEMEYANGGEFGKVAFTITNDYYGNLELGFYDVEINEQYNSYKSFMKYSDAVEELIKYLKSEDGAYIAEKNPKSKFEIEMVYYNSKLDKYKNLEPQRKTVLSVKASMVKDFTEKRIFEGGGETKMIDGVMYEKVKFSNGVEDYYYSSDLHKVNFYCNEHGLNPKNQKDFEKAFSELKKQNKISYKGGGKTTFKEKATAIAKNFEGKKVEPKYQKEYGKTYDKAEAKEVGNKIAGSQKAKYDSKMSGGGSTKRGGAMQLAKQIRKDGESWQSALKRANEQMRKK